MSKTQDALKHAEDQRQLAPDEFGRVREILLGDLPAVLERGLERLEHRLTEQRASLVAEIEGLRKRLDERISGIEARSAHEQTELRDQIVSQADLLRQSILEHSEKAMARVKEGVSVLQRSKLDRASFGGFLRETAERLADES